MLKKVIKVAEKKLNFEPNLADYGKGYANFNLKQVKEELGISGKMNAAAVAIERQSNGDNRNKVAMYWVGEDRLEKKFTFAEINLLANKFANLLLKLGIDEGERVFFFLPRIPELYFGFLGTLKRAAIAGTLFSAFQEQALFDRLESSGTKLLVTNKELYPRVEKIKHKLPNLKKILLVEELDRELEKMEGEFETRMVEPQRPAFMLYTSGTTGKPKGVVHAHEAVVHQYITGKWVLDFKAGDMYWCTADPGWVTGIAYEILGNWANGVTTVIYNGKFDPETWYEILQDYGVNVWYTAPTAIRMLMAAGEALPKKYDLSLLRHMCSVGEPLNPEAVWWGMKVFGKPFHDTWWQTETGGMMVCNYPAMEIRPGSMGKPVPGVAATILDDDGKELGVGKEGSLALKKGWSAMMVKIWRRPKKYMKYFKKGWYISGDLAFKDKDGYFWFVGRDDDVIKTSGERVGPFEVESSLIEYPGVVEAGVIGKPDPLRGQIIKAFVVLKPGVKGTDKLKEELSLYVKKHLAGHAYPKEIEFIDKLPKTRSGKIMRRMLRNKDAGLPLGDTSTLDE